jgi:hypothetical protein
MIELDCTPLNEAETKSKTMVVRGKPINYHYLAPCVYKLLRAAWGGVLAL